MCACRFSRIFWPFFDFVILKMIRETMNRLTSRQGCTWNWKRRDRDFIKNRETETRNFQTENRDLKLCGLCRIKMSSPLLSWNLFEILGFFLSFLTVSSFQIQQTKTRWITEDLLSCIAAVFKISRQPVAFETGTETRKNRSRDDSRDRDQVSRLHWITGQILGYVQMSINKIPAVMIFSWIIVYLRT